MTLIHQLLNDSQDNTTLFEMENGFGYAITITVNSDRSLHTTTVEVDYFNEEMENQTLSCTYSGFFIMMIQT